MNKENKWNHKSEANMMEGHMEKVIRKGITIAARAMTPGKAPGPLEVCAKMTPSRGKVGMSMMMELCQREMVPIYKRKGDVRNCNAYREAKLLQHTMKIVKRVLKSRI